MTSVQAHRASVQAVLFAASVVGAGEMPAQKAWACDSVILNSASGNNAYKPRGGRCEGTYGRKVAQDRRLMVVSFVDSLDDYVPKPQGALNVRWMIASGPRDSVRIEARSFNKKPFYAMDARVAATERQFVWPQQVLFQEQLRRANLGVVAWTDRIVGGTRRRIHLPVQVTTGAPSPERDGYEITLFPSGRPESVFVSLSRLDSAGAPIQAIWNRKLLNYGTYQAETPIRFRLPRLPASGLYQVDISGRQRNGTAIPVDPLLLIHCGPTPHPLC